MVARAPFWGFYINGRTQRGRALSPLPSTLPTDETEVGPGFQKLFVPPVP